ncbi:hypothetical protein GCM10009584_14280 [Ornithinimicrobium humiphilum]|uniref:Uncharacterized protein YfeS n=1 Tax=Ornithinimicrobium humiphilum TaxID=125288 RepID=A0A543KKC7_9MICO|nr:hypothetical protein [Ornithinimicrobium humiphilum]TQM95521.1 uncharacterized protein YfeS [Ornithinimicrobium humiphilum]
MNEDDDDLELPEAHPAFRAHFVDPLYEDTGEEFAPFGSDEGWDIVRDLAYRRDELGPGTTVARLLAEQGLDDVGMEPAADPDETDVDTPTIVNSTGFALLRLTGRIDEPGRQLVLRALRVLEDFYGPQSQLAVQRRDLEAWRS